MSSKKNFTETQSPEMTDNIFNNSVDPNGDTTITKADSATIENNTTVAPPTTAEPKQQRIGIKQRKLDFESYKATYRRKHLPTASRPISVGNCMTALP